MEERRLQLYTLHWHLCERADLDQGRGLFQVYGDSPIYGQDALLFLGQYPLSSADQNRLAEMGTLGRQPNLSYRISRLSKLSDGALEQILSILVVMHKPSFNERNLSTPHRDTYGRLILLHNHGERGALHLEVSNYYFLKPGQRPEDGPVYRLEA